VRAKLKPEHIAAAKKAIEDLGGHERSAFGIPKGADEAALVLQLKKNGFDIGPTGLKGYRLLDRLVFVGILARHVTGGSFHTPRRVSYTVAGTVSPPG
jgi:hypothetical protein